MAGGGFQLSLEPSLYLMTLVFTNFVFSILNVVVGAAYVPSVRRLLIR